MDGLVLRNPFFSEYLLVGCSSARGFSDARISASCPESEDRDDIAKSSGMTRNRHLALPKEVEHWSLTTLRNKLIKIDAKVVRHGRYVTFQLAEVAVSKNLFR